MKLEVKTRNILLASGGLAVVLGLIAGNVYSQSPLQPVTMEWEETGDSVYVKRGILSRHPNGSVAESERAHEIDSGKALSEVRIINDTVLGTRTTVDDRSATRVTIPINAKKFETQGKLAKVNCGADLATVPSDSLLGWQIYRVVHRELAGPEGSRGIEVWVAPDLDCLEVKKVSYEIREGQRRERLRRVATRIEANRLNAELFLIPTHYREVKPSEQMSFTLQRDLGENPVPAESLRRIDAAYENSRKKLR